ncbi:hypothetical protein CEV08_04835 [Bartonella tribocorum]|uniref:Uncharacterized protein n=1 Tax=Bartonella tribocorum TaxID=85701 RepID=A0A2M6UVK3_9HYPH|nr:hypothetical protein CEV08_04835 [Bartonella tribocorum]
MLEGKSEKITNVQETDFDRGMIDFKARLIKVTMNSPQNSRRFDTTNRMFHKSLKEFIAKVFLNQNFVFNIG